MNLEDAAHDLIHCPRCAAKPGRSCIAKSGSRSSRSHSARSAPLYEAWRDGYGEGRSDMARSALVAAKSNDGAWGPFVVRAERAIADAEASR